jgi:DHA1 family tetracycline resistance protein-like MFS transporter
VLIDVIGIGIIIPVIPSLIVALSPGADMSSAAKIGGYLITAYALMQWIFAPIMGELSDRFGRKPILLIALCGLGLDFLLSALAPTIAWLFAGRLIAGIFGASHTVAAAYIADISTKENKAKNFGLLGAAFGLGFIIGPAIGGIIGSNWGPRAPFFVAAGFTMLNFLFGLLVVPESLPKPKRRKINFKKMIPLVSLYSLSQYKTVLGFVVAYILVQLAGQTLNSTWTFFTIESFNWTESQVGISLAVVGVLVSIVQAGLTGFMVKKFGNRKVITIGFTFLIIGMFGFAFSSNQFYLYAALVPYVFGGIAGPTIQSIISNKVPDTEQGNLQGALTSMVSLTAVFGPLLYTWLFSTYTAQDTAVYFPGAPF